MQTKSISPLLRLATVAVAALVASGCDTTKATYSTGEHMISIDTYHRRLPLGPCNHSYGDGYEILLQKGLDRCDASQLQAYSDMGKLTVTAGYVAVDRAKRTAVINLTFLGRDMRDNSEGPARFFYNGKYRYEETNGAIGGVTREFLKKLHGKDRPVPYYHH